MRSSSRRSHFHHSRRVNPRIQLLTNCLENTYYLDDEIPERRLSVVAEGPSDDSANMRASHCSKSGVPSTEREQDEQDDDDFILLTIVQPKVKTAEIVVQDEIRISTLQERRRPKLSMFPGLKHYSTPKHYSKNTLQSESSHVHQRSIPEIRLSSPAEEDECHAEDSQKNNNDSGVARLEVPLHSRPSCKHSQRLLPRESVSMDDCSNFFKSSLGLHRKSISLCACSTVPRTSRKLSKTIKALCASEGFMVPRMSRPSIHLAVEDFEKITRRFSKEQVKSVLFSPRGQIAIYRLTNERFFNVNELVHKLHAIFSL
ncbi:hypothetical protein Q1695_000890 [Nippostrongylus brasiliensis]|nr:hypothetical protein Q1695_000890 [Nippostrongylus brasiliensis]